MARNTNEPTTAAEPLVRIEGLRKSFGDHEVLRNIDFDVMPGQVVTIIGASGPPVLALAPRRSPGTRTNSAQSGTMLNATLTSEMSPLGMRFPTVTTTCITIHASVMTTPATALHTGNPAHHARTRHSERASRKSATALCRDALPGSSSD